MDSFLKAVTSFKDKIVKTPLERLVHDACTDENWGVANTSLHQISDRTHNHEERSIIMRNIWELLTSPSKEWRRLYKVLNLLDHLLKFGSSSCISEIKDNIFKIKMFQDFSFREGIEEKGIGVRDKAKYLTQMLSDSRVFDEEREKAQKMWNKMNGSNNHSGGESFRSRSGFDTGNSFHDTGNGLRNDGFTNRENRFNPTARNDAFNTGFRDGNASTGYRSEPASAGLRPDDSIRKDDIFKPPEVNKFSLWDTPAVRSAASPSNGELKSIKPPTGFHPANVHSKPSLTHSQSVSSKTFDLLFEDPVPSPQPSVFFPVPSSAKTSSSLLPSDLLSVNPANPVNLMNPINPISPSPSLQSSTANLGIQDLLFQPSGPPSKPSVNLIQETYCISGGSSFQPPPTKSDFSLPSDLFGAGLGSFPGFHPVEKTEPSRSSNLLNSSNETSGKKLNVNISGGTSMDQMKTFGTSGFSSFVSAPAKPASLESKLFNLDDLEAGQPKVKEVIKNKW